MKRRDIYALTTCAILVAMSTVLSFLVVYEAPLGGSITILSMLPVCIAGFLFGPKWGFGTAFVYSITQLLVGVMRGQFAAWGLTFYALVICIIFDYLVAFTVLGITGIFKGKGRVGICIGVFIAVALRMVCHYITGVTIWEIWMPETWDNVWLYSLAYNAQYMLPEAIFTMIGTVAISAVPQLWKIMDGKKQ